MLTMSFPGLRTFSILTLPVLFILTSLTQKTDAANVVADLSQRLVPITTGFSGTDVLLFGAIDPGDGGRKDVIVTVKGPSNPIKIRKKDKIAGVWLKTASASFKSAPGFYAVFGSRPLEEILPDFELDTSEIGLDHLSLNTEHSRFSPNIEIEWRDALTRNMQNEGLYSSQVGRITMLSEQLFRTDLHLPANVPTGTYTIGFYTVENNSIVGGQTMPLIVRKAGIGAWVYKFSHKSPALYGIICVLIAIAAGYASFAAFRRA
jgi:uncharacterized protein (TIGR02186 family)